MRELKKKKLSEFEKEKILENDRSKHKRYCKCGHSIIFPKNSKTDKTICSYCGCYIFKNDLLEFEYRLKERIKKK